jgi:hypothetical protein
MMPSLGPLIAELEAWRIDGGSFHGDRQLADKILIAVGWLCEPDARFEGGVGWFSGVNPKYSGSEGSRPHPINDLDAAVGVVPLGCGWWLRVIGGASAVAHVWRKGEIFRDEFEGVSERPSVALVIAALRCKQASTSSDHE